MTAAIVERDESAEAARDHYRYTRTVDVAGRIVRATVKRDFYAEYSLAYVEMINDHKAWTQLADEPTAYWWDDTPPPRTDIAPADHLGKVAERLIHRATTILTPPTTTTAPTLTPQVRDAINVLLVGNRGYGGELRIRPENITWATGHGNTLHIIEHNDGSVTFTRAHHDDCPFITTAGEQDCDNGCDIPPHTNQ